MTHATSIEMLRAVMGSSHLHALVAGQNTHDPALRFSFDLVKQGVSDEDIESIVRAALPPGYSGDTLDELPRMIEGARAKLGKEDADADDFLSALSGGKKSSVAQAALRTVLARVDLFKDEQKQAYMSVPNPSGGRLCYPVDSREAALFVRECHYRSEDARSLTAAALAEVLASLETRAIFDGPTLDVFRRVGRKGKAVYIDLGGSDGEVVEITPSGWRIVPAAPFAFIRDECFKPLPHPVSRNGNPGVVQEFFDVLGLSTENRILTTGFLISALRGEGPHICMIVDGAQSSGKTFFSRVMKTVLDPSAIDPLPLPSDKLELLLQASRMFMPIYDNTSGMKGELSDTFCQIATGGTLAKRRLYSNGDMFVVKVGTPFIINGIGDFVSRPDLLDRAIPIHLEIMEKRRSQKELENDIADKLPRFLGALYDAVSHALGSEKVADAAAQVRMIDGAQWITAAEPALGIEPGSFVRHLKERQTEANSELVNNEPVVPVLRALLEGGPFVGTVGSLFLTMNERRGNPAGLPQTPMLLSRTLKRIGHLLGPVGVHVRFEAKNKSGRMVRIWKEGQDPASAKEREPLPEY